MLNRKFSAFKAPTFHILIVGKHQKNMKILLLLLTTSLLTNLTIAQTTAIPDSNFEQALINFGYDTGIPDGTVLKVA